MFKSFHQKKSFVNLFRFISNQRQQLPISVLTKKWTKNYFQAQRFFISGCNGHVMGCMQCLSGQSFQFPTFSFV